MIIPVMMAIRVVPSMFAADVMSMDPVTVPGAVAGYPDHLVIAVPIAGTMAVVGPVTDLYTEFIGPESGRQNNTRSHQGDEKESILLHNSDSCGTC
jgi:hypothetical protein